MIAQPHIPEKTGDGRLWQLVIFLVEHGPSGSVGLILNRPASATVGDLLSWGYSSVQACTQFLANLLRSQCAMPTVVVQYGLYIIDYKVVK